jgi:hypothetical protein
MTPTKIQAMQSAVRFVRTALLPLLVAAVCACEQTSGIDGAPSGGGSASVGGPATDSLSCTTRRDCTYAIVPAVESTDDCTCPVCPSEASSVVNRTTHEARMETFRKVCGEWSKSNACMPGFCSSPTALACVDGQCRLAGE